MKFTDLMAQAATGHATITEEWTQGRTTYGGLSAALCYAAARTKRPENMLLRSAQIAFVGPASGTVHLSAEVLRQGKSACFVTADVRSDAGIATRGTFIFGAARQSKLQIDNLPKPPDVPKPEDTNSFFPDSNRRPGFTRNFNLRLAAGTPPMSGSDKADISLWMRHLDEDASGLIALLAIGDAPPPAAISVMTEPGRISSMNWSIDILTNNPVTEDRWYLARHVSPQASDGYSHQTMMMWNTDGVPMMASQQTIAVFG